MSLDKHETIPVDTHVWQIAVREYMPHLKNHKTLTDKLYNQIGKNFLFCNFYRRATKLGEGNVFTGFCQSFCQFILYLWSPCPFRGWGIFGNINFNVSMPSKFNLANPCRLKILKNSIVSYQLYLFPGDCFRDKWGEYAGWAQSVSYFYVV